eukprot:1408135-Rhodomonas_salina.2
MGYGWKVRMVSGLVLRVHGLLRVAGIMVWGCCLLPLPALRQRLCLELLPVRRVLPARRKGKGGEGGMRERRSTTSPCCLSGVLAGEDDRREKKKERAAASQRQTERERDRAEKKENERREERERELIART